MRATVMFGAGDVRIQTVPDASINELTDAVLVVSRACICGSDLWPYRTMEHSDTGRRMGHEAIGVVEAVGNDGIQSLAGNSSGVLDRDLFPDLQHLRPKTLQTSYVPATMVLMIRRPPRPSKSGMERVEDGSLIPVERSL